MTTDLREELAALAETQSFSADPSAWDRGRRARRRARVVRAGAVVSDSSETGLDTTPRTLGNGAASGKGITRGRHLRYNHAPTI